MTLKVKINDIPFDEQLNGICILKYATPHIDIDELDNEQIEDILRKIMDDDVDYAFKDFAEYLEWHLGEAVAEKFGREYGEAYMGLPDNGNGIWFEGLKKTDEDGITWDFDEYNPQLCDEIKEYAAKLANDTEWLNENLPEREIEIEVNL